MSMDPTVEEQIDHLQRLVGGLVSAVKELGNRISPGEGDRLAQEILKP